MHTPKVGSTFEIAGCQANARSFGGSIKAYDSLEPLIIYQRYLTGYSAAGKLKLKFLKRKAPPNPAQTITRVNYLDTDRNYLNK